MSNLLKATSQCTLISFAKQTLASSAAAAHFNSVERELLRIIIVVAHDYHHADANSGQKSKLKTVCELVCARNATQRARALIIATFSQCLKDVFGVVVVSLSSCTFDSALLLC